MIGMDARTGALLDGEDHLRQSIADILGTPLGSRIARRDYGSLLPELIDQPLNPVGRIGIIAAAALALLRQEPRIRATRITFEPGDRAGAAVLRIEGQRLDAPRRGAATALTIPVRGLSALAA